MKFRRSRRPRLTRTELQPFAAEDERGDGDEHAAVERVAVKLEHVGAAVGVGAAEDRPGFDAAVRHDAEVRLEAAAEFPYSLRTSAPAKSSPRLPRAAGRRRGSSSGCGRRREKSDLREVAPRCVPFGRAIVYVRSGNASAGRSSARRLPLSKSVTFVRGTSMVMKVAKTSSGRARPWRAQGALLRRSGTAADPPARRHGHDPSASATSGRPYDISAPIVAAKPSADQVEEHVRSSSAPRTAAAAVVRHGGPVVENQHVRGFESGTSPHRYSLFF